MVTSDPITSITPKLISVPPLPKVAFEDVIMLLDDRTKLDKTLIVMVGAISNVWLVPDNVQEVIFALARNVIVEDPCRTKSKYMLYSYRKGNVMKLNIITILTCRDRRWKRNY